ncbi:MAG: hypothetical protein RLZZ70_428 [Candidatus Parcubacteria bacterium]
MNKLHNKIVVWLILGVVIACSIWITITPADTLIGYFGTENIFVFMYLIAFIGSISTFASIPYPLILLGLAAGGIDPLLIGIVSALGVMTADSFTFLVTKQGRALLSDKLLTAAEQLGTRINAHPRLLTPGLMLYGTIAPLSNDFAVITLATMRYSYWRVIPPLAIGNIIYNIGIAYLGVYSYDWIVGLV